jgi:hypothetical protein
MLGRFKLRARLAYLISVRIAGGGLARTAKCGGVFALQLPIGTESNFAV